MKTDSFFKIGSSHNICQDYCIHGKINDFISYAIISDGCTMSHEECKSVDTGARILCHCAKSAIFEIFKNNNRIDKCVLEKKQLESYFRQSLLHNVFLIKNKLLLENVIFDATLLVLLFDKNNNNLFFTYGDGSIFIKTKDDERYIKDITYLSGAPYYLSYQLDVYREIEYLNAFSKSPILLDLYNVSEQGEINKKESEQTFIDENLFDKNCFSINEIGEIDFISIMSDGFKTFSNSSKNLMFTEVISEFNNIKNRNGVFIDRRCKSVLKKYQKDLIENYDDISISTIMS